MSHPTTRSLKLAFALALFGQTFASWAITAPVVTNRTRVTTPAPVVSTPVIAAPKPATVPTPTPSTPAPVVIISICPSNAGSLCGRST